VPAKPAARRDYFLPTFILLIAFAWLALWVWEQSPYGRYINHGLWSQDGPGASLCRAISGGEVIVPAFLFVGGWLLMTAAMMLPSTLPLLEIFRRLTARRVDQSVLLSLLVAGYLLVWALFGIVAHVLSWAILETGTGSVWLKTYPWIPGAIVLFIAGAFQFSRFKYTCLDKCRSPFMFVMQHWRGRDERRHSFLLGMHHGAYCVGCCWALMLLMFAVGTGSVGWMLLLGAVMAVEKNVSWGRRLSAPLGIALLACSGVILGQALA